MPPVDPPTPLNIFQNCPELDNTGNQRRQEKYLCPHCSKVFCYPSSFHSHVQSHFDKRFHACHICKKVFSKKCDFIRHWMTHTHEKSCKCDLCDYNAAHASELERHLFNRHGIERAQNELQL